MKKIFFIALINTLAVATLFSQKEMKLPGEITWGNEIREPANSYLSDILGVDDNGFYTLRQKARYEIEEGARD